MMKHYNIPIFVPHCGCPFDCVFCNQKHITGIVRDLSEEEIIKIIEDYLSTIPENTEKEIAYFGGSFTGIENSVRERYLSIAYRYVRKGDVSGIRISTRPDYIDEEILLQLKRYGVTTIELGVQSMDEEVLAASGRGHNGESVRKASKLIKSFGFSLGLQMMTGLPGDNEEKSLNTAEKIIEQKPDCVRIYPTLVIEDTRLAQMYRSGEYKPQDLEGAVALTAKLLKKFREKNINVIRVGLAVTEEISPGGKLIAGPFHESFRELCESRVFFNEIAEKIPHKTAVAVAINPADISRMVGYRKSNIIRLREQLGIEVKIQKDARIKRGNLKFR